MSETSTNPPQAEDRQRLQEAWDDALAMLDGGQPSRSGKWHRRQSFSQEWKSQHAASAPDRRQQPPAEDDRHRPNA